MSKFKDFKNIDEIAKKHNVSLKFLKKQLNFGIKIEHEHTNNPEVAKTIALQHLGEFPDYYSHLKSLEHTAKTDNKLNRLENRVLNNVCNIISERSNPLKDPRTQIINSRGAGALTPDAARKLGPKAVQLQKTKAATVDLPKLKESMRLPNKMGNLYNVSLNWRGKYIEVNVFFPQLRMPKKSEVQFEIRKIYPDARVITYIPADRYTSKTFVYVNEDVVDESLKKDGRKLSFTRLFRGTTKPRAELARGGNTSMSDKGSLGSGHYVTHSQKKANQYSKINSKQRNEPAAKVTYLVPSKRVEKIREIPKANSLSDKPRELPKGKKVIVNKTSGHSVFPDPKDAQKYMVKKPQPIIRKPKSKISEDILEKVNTTNLKCNEPKASPTGDSQTGKSHVVKACSNGTEKTIRFGQRGVSGSPKKEGESEAYKSRRERFQARHSKNIKKGKMSAAFWSNKTKW